MTPPTDPSSAKGQVVVWQQPFTARREGIIWTTFAKGGPQVKFMGGVATYLARVEWEDLSPYDFSSCDKTEMAKARISL